MNYINLIDFLNSATEEEILKRCPKAAAIAYFMDEKFRESEYGSSREKVDIAMFYTDMRCYRDLGNPATECVYIAGPDGPIAVLVEG